MAFALRSSLWLPGLSPSLDLNCSILARLCSTNHWSMNWMLHAHLSIIKLNTDLTIRKLAGFENCYNQRRHDLHSNKQRLFFPWSIWGQGMRYSFPVIQILHIWSLSVQKSSGIFEMRVVAEESINHGARTENSYTGHSRRQQNSCVPEVSHWKHSLDVAIVVFKRKIVS